MATSKLQKGYRYYIQTDNNNDPVNCTLVLAKKAPRTGGRYVDITDSLVVCCNPILSANDVYLVLTADNYSGNLVTLSEAESSVAGAINTSTYSFTIQGLVIAIQNDGDITVALDDSGSDLHTVVILWVVYNDQDGNTVAKKVTIKMDYTA